MSLTDVIDVLDQLGLLAPIQLAAVIIIAVTVYRYFVSHS